jgi:hypothetical protein
LPTVSEKSDTKARRVALARSIGRRFCGSGKLKPVSWWAATPITCQIVCQRQLVDVGWLYVADRLRTLADDHYRRAIDHEWALAYDDDGGETWGIVSEPYIEDAAVKGLCRALRRALDEWDVDVHLLPSSQSAWAPDNHHCRPIVMVMRQGGLLTFLQRAGRAVVEELARTW